MSIFNSLLAGAEGLEFEAGTWTPATQTARGRINFSKTHDKPPAAFILWDTGETNATNNSACFDFCIDYEALFGEALPNTFSGMSPAGFRLGAYYTSSSRTLATNYLTYGASDPGESTKYYYRYHATEECIKPFVDTSYYWRVTRAYKWIAIWT